MATSKDDVDVPDYDADVNEVDETQRASAKSKQSERKSFGSTSGEPSGSRKGRSSRRPSRSKQDEDQSDLPPEEKTKREPFTATLERGLRSRMNGMVHHGQSAGEPQHVASISDYVNLAIGEKLARDERHLNNGKRFPEPVHMRTGRPRKRR